MQNLPTISAWLKNVSDSHGLSPIMLRITFNRKLIYKATGFKAEPNNFQPQTLIGSKDINAEFKNAEIRKQMSDLERKFLLLRQEDNLNHQSIKMAVSGETTTTALSFTMLNLKVRASYEHILSPGTIRQYKAEATKLEKFKKETVYVHQINNQFLNDYHRYMKVDLKNSDNTVRKTFVKLHAIFEKAMELKLIKENPLQGYKIPSYKPPIRQTLTEDEQKRVIDYAYNGANEYYRLVACWFALQMHCGFRYSDLEVWDEAKIVRNDKIYFKDKKTGTVHYIPLHPELKKSIARVRGLRRIPVNQDCNRVLKEIGKLCEIGIKLTTHIARHTFAVDYLDRGGSLEVLQMLLGHNSIKTTAIYGRISSKRIDSEAAAVWGR